MILRRLSELKYDIAFIAGYSTYWLHQSTWSCFVVSYERCCDAEVGCRFECAGIDDQWRSQWSVNNLNQNTYRENT